MCVKVSLINDGGLIQTEQRDNDIHDEGCSLLCKST